ncbi:uncharacterized protein LACBIDRAFT_307712 [Laccaria bicolor S238N-H82]|uniref:Predicted protein n=1 Tax=Laccaria bicolor (strain S238N-H82 / ATCC MYA-4686) TaxID=486041 RepID=B0DQT0_LACBS|nr:uncharacterized protein LACBIDRAFT_307712 [Laccaria bicolor S238N-H82]EDR03168.1 predicted protein [Laccaria bicolor S238N-H82]|eukprot:XP_001886309.1 predicted protein [Laccaria bicolor S238N-H82]
MVGLPSHFRSHTSVNFIDTYFFQTGVRVGVSLTMSTNDDEDFIRAVTSEISRQLMLNSNPHLFAVASTAQSISSIPNTLIIRGSSEDYVHRAQLLASSKFIGRIITSFNEGNQWVATISDIGASMYDEAALWDVVRKSAREPVDPLLPPPGSRRIGQILTEARSKLERITPMQAFDELRESKVNAPTFLVDIRTAAQREMQGGIYGSLIIERNVLEWRFDPRADSRLAIADRFDLRIIVFCQEGYASSLAAYSLQQLGLLNATDMIGGYEAWREAGLPIDIDQAHPRSLVSLAGSVV